MPLRPSGRIFAIEPLAFAAVVVLAVALRVAAIFDEPWLDELWSLGLARHATSAWQIVTGDGYRLDNNHWLNTIYLFLLGDRWAFYPYRLLSVASAVGTLILLWPITRAWGAGTAVCAAALVGASFVFVQYQSEARGYAPAAFFAVLALLLARRFVATRSAWRWASAGGFAAASVLGFLSHATFLYAFVGAFAYLAIAGRPNGWRDVPRFAGDVVGFFAVPTAFAAWLYVAVIKVMKIGGGPRVDVNAVLANAARHLVGVPVPDEAGWVAVAVLAVVAAYGAAVLRRRGRDEWAFLVTAGLIGPALVLLLVRPQPLYARYLFVAMPFVLLLLAAAAVDAVRRGGGWRVIGGAAVLAFVAGNALHLARFYADGRGHTAGVLRYLAENTRGPDITLAAAQKFRAAILFQYFTPRVAMNGKAVRYVPPQSPSQPEWFLLDTAEHERIEPVIRVFDWPVPYRRKADFFFYGMSGQEWHLYRLEPKPPAKSLLEG